MNKERISIFHPQGLGDAIICNGFCRYYANNDSTEKVYVYVRKRYIDIVRWMYRDNLKIVPIPVSVPHSEAYSYCSNIAKTLRSKVIFVGNTPVNKYNDIHKKYKKFDEIIYELGKVPYDHRFKSFYIQRELDIEKQVAEKLGAFGSYAFVHDDPEKGFILNPKTSIKQIRNDKSINPFHLCSILENAEEIHLMESSIKNLCEQLMLKSKKLFRYDKVRQQSGYTGWKISKERYTWQRIF
jgi:hypothetical protein